MLKFKRFRALADKSAWLLILPSLITLYFVDEAMAKTLLQWLTFAPVLAGVAILVSRIVFPQVNLTELVKEAQAGNVAAGILASSVVAFVAVVMLALVMWAKA